MLKTFQNMREIARKPWQEIINHNYARIMFTNEEITSFPNAINDLVNVVKESAENLKNRLGISINAIVVGNEKNIVLFEGVGDLYEQSPEDFVALMNLKREFSSTPSSTPVSFTSASSMSMASNASEPAPVTTPARAVRPIKAHIVVKPAISNHAAAPVPVAKPAVVVNIVKTAKTAVPSSTGSGKKEECFAFLDVIVDESGIVEHGDAVDQLVSKAKVSPEVASKFVELYIGSSDKVRIQDGFIFKKDE